MDTVVRRRLLVGLGNPGRKYDGTRHNVGFEILNQFQRQHGGTLPTSKFDGQFLTIRGEQVDWLLLWPLTYMNLSGRSVLQAVSFFKLPVSQVLVICDDMSLPIGQLRLRPGGSSGGQNGLGDIVERLGTQQVPRLRVGVGQPMAGRDAVTHVLGKFSAEEKAFAEQAVQRGAEAAWVWGTEGMSAAMNRFNQRTSSSKES